MTGKTSLDLRFYSEEKADEVKWLWKPYFAYGKVSIVQGDPGEGKSTFMINVAASVSNGGTLPNGGYLPKPQNVIYQCSEDDIADTIKPRMISAHANCNRIAYLDEEQKDLTLSDDRLKEAILKFNAKLVIIDPLQSYIGDADISYAGGMRKLLHRLRLFAKMGNCSIVLIGHLNKNESTKTLYRGLGSIEGLASARSVIQVERVEGNPEIRRVRQIKSNNSAPGSEVYFTIDSERGFKWVDGFASPVNGSPECQEEQELMTKQELGVVLLQSLLRLGPAKVNDIYEEFSRRGISQRTALYVKQFLGIKSIRKDGQWFWMLPNAKAGDE